MHDENLYVTRAKAAFSRIEAAFDDIDPEIVDCERSSSDVVALLFPNGVKCVINTQRPTQQIWVAAGAEAWHFGYDPASERWIDSKRPELELFSTLSQIIQTQGGLVVDW